MLKHMCFFAKQGLPHYTEVWLISHLKIGLVTLDFQRPQLGLWKRGSKLTGQSIGIKQGAHAAP